MNIDLLRKWKEPVVILFLLARGFNLLTVVSIWHQMKNVNQSSKGLKPSESHIHTHSCRCRAKEFLCAAAAD